MNIGLFIDNIARNRLWQEQPQLLQVLGLLPLLAVSDSAETALALAAATLGVVTATTLLSVWCQRQLLPAIRLPALLLLIAALAICAGRLLQAWTYAIYADLGSLMPLPFVLCMLLLQADLLADKAPPLLVYRSTLTVLPILLLFGALALPPPAIFMLLAGLLALANTSKQRRASAMPATDTQPTVPGSKRVRVTGKI